MHTTATTPLTCDGCGQPASQEHIARRLQRLECTTRYRPIHMNALLLGGVSPLVEEEFLYSGKFRGEGGRLLEAVGISTAGKSAEAVLSEFQRAGLFLTHVLECPLERSQGGEASALETLLVRRVPTVATRIRRSLKPKRVVLISGVLLPIASKLSSSELGCPVVQNGANPFDLDSVELARALQQLRQPASTAVAEL